MARGTTSSIYEGRSLRANVFARNIVVTSDRADAEDRQREHNLLDARLRILVAIEDSTSFAEEEGESADDAECGGFPACFHFVLVWFD
jgi:hypothetical protein